MVTPQPQQPQQSSAGTPPGTVVTAVSVTEAEANEFVSILEDNAASQPLNQTLANPNGLANQNMVPQTNPNLVNQTNQNSVEVPKNSRKQSIEGQGLSMPIIAIQNAMSWSNSEPQNKFSKNFQKRSKFSRQKFRKFRQISMSKNVIRMVLGRSRKKFCHKNIISNKIPKKLLKH
jgi:hypothetical protein